MPFENGNTQNSQRKRSRKAVRFNLSYSQNVKINNGKLFIKLVKKHFPENSKYDKIFKIINFEADLLLYHQRLKDHERTCLKSTELQMSVSLNVLFTKLYL